MPLQQLAEIYGVLDEGVRASRDGGSITPAILDPTLHGVTPGWYQGLIDASPESVRRPDLVGSINSIDAEVRRDGKPLSLAQKVALFSMLTEIARTSPTARDATASPNFVEPHNDATLTTALQLMMPDEVSSDDRPDLAARVAPELFRMAQSVESLEGKQLLKSYAVDRGVLPPEALYVKDTQTRLADINGYTCVVIDTECGSPDVSLENLLKIVNPYNWHDNYDEFFKSMEGVGPSGPDGWPRVLETVALAGGDTWQVRTPLRFHTRQDDHTAQLDYDLALPLPPGGDGKARVDHGWINMWANNPGNVATQPGVRVRTKKIVHVDPLIPQIQQVLLGPLGYGLMSAEFLFGPAKSPSPTAHPFHYRGPDGGDPPGPAGLSAPGTASQQANARHFAPTAVGIWTNMVRGLVTDYADVAGKWMNGGITVDEFANYAATTSDRVIRAPFEYLEAMTQPRIPGHHRGHGTESEGQS